MNFSKSIFLCTLSLLTACGNVSRDDRSSSGATSTLAVSNAREMEGGEAAVTDYAKTLPLEKIKLPDGFTIAVYAEVENARSMAISHPVGDVINQPARGQRDSGPVGRRLRVRRPDLRFVRSDQARPRRPDHQHVQLVLSGEPGRARDGPAG